MLGSSRKPMISRTFPRLLTREVVRKAGLMDYAPEPVAAFIVAEALQSIFRSARHERFP